MEKVPDRKIGARNTDPVVAPGYVQFYIVTTWETPGNHWC